MAPPEIPGAAVPVVMPVVSEGVWMVAPPARCEPVALAVADAIADVDSAAVVISDVELHLVFDFGRADGDGLPVFIVEFLCENGRGPARFERRPLPGQVLPFTDVVIAGQLGDGTVAGTGNVGMGAA